MEDSFLMLQGSPASGKVESSGQKIEATKKMGWITDAAEKPESIGWKIGLHGRGNQWDGR